MSLVALALHIGLLALTVAIIIPAGLTLFVMLVWEMSRTPESERETHATDDHQR